MNRGGSNSLPPHPVDPHKLSSSSSSVGTGSGLSPLTRLQPPHVQVIDVPIDLEPPVKNPLRSSTSSLPRSGGGVAPATFASFQQQQKEQQQQRQQQQQKQQLNMSYQEPLQPPSAFLPPPPLVPCSQCAALEGELDAKELLLRRLSEGMQHWKTTLKERVRQELQAQQPAASAAPLDKAAEVLGAWRARGDEALLLVTCLGEWRSVAAASSLRSLKSRVDEVNGERRRLERVVTILRKNLRLKPEAESSAPVPPVSDGSDVNDSCSSAPASSFPDDQAAADHLKETLLALDASVRSFRGGADPSLALLEASSGSLLMEGPQLVRNLCAEAIRRLRVTEAAAVQMLRSLRSESAEYQHRIRCIENDLVAAQSRVHRLQWLEEAQQMLGGGGGSGSDVDARLISAANVLKAQQQDMQAFQRQNEQLSEEVVLLQQKVLQLQDELLQAQSAQAEEGAETLPGDGARALEEAGGGPAAPAPALEGETSVVVAEQRAMFSSCSDCTYPPSKEVERWSKILKARSLGKGSGGGMFGLRKPRLLSVHRLFFADA